MRFSKIPKPFLILSEHDHGHDAPSSQVTNGADIEVTVDLQLHRDHRHKVAVQTGFLAKRELGFLAVMIHVMGDALNNIGIIIAALVIWFAKYPGRYYADPGVSMGISMMIVGTSIPFSISSLSFHLAHLITTVKSAGSILLQSLPPGVSLSDIQHDLESIPGVVAIHELHVWRLSQHKSIATAHVVTSEMEVRGFAKQAKLIAECLHAYGIHSTTLQAEHTERKEGEACEQGKQCQIGCGTLCEVLTCCG